MGKVKSSEKYITDDKGARVGVIIDIRHYRKMLEAMEELECIRAYDAAKASGDEAIPFEKAVRQIEKSRP
jgi:hypothetical protein